MSSFVPLRERRDFRVGLVGGAEAEVQEGSAAEEPRENQDQGPIEDAFPSTVEQLDELLNAAVEKGRAMAEDALAQARAEVQEQGDRLERLVTAMQQGRKDWAEEVRNQLGELVVLGVRQVISDSADLKEAALRDRMAEVGERMIGERDVLIRVRAEDEAVAKELIAQREGWQVVVDPSIGGGVFAETERGKIDATIGAASAGLAQAVSDWQDEGANEE